MLSLQKIKFYTTVVCLITTVSFSNAQIFVNDDATGTNDGTSWANAYINLQDALDSASFGDDIWVAEGTYKPSSYPDGCSGCTTPRDYTFHIKDGINLYGGFTGTESTLEDRVLDYFNYPSILSGSLEISPGLFENVYHVVLLEFREQGGAGGLGLPENNKYLDGFVITDGEANGFGNISMSSPGNIDISRNNGAGIYAFSFSGLVADEFTSRTLSNNRIIDNTANENGGGIYVNNGFFNITNNTIEFNTANIDGGGIYAIDGVFNIRNNEVLVNAADNAGGGIYILSGDNTLIDQNRFEDNRVESSGGAIVIQSSGVSVTNNDINGNKAGVFNPNPNPNPDVFLGGGIYIDNSTVALSKNSITYNRAITEGGGIYALNSTIVLDNNQVTLNSGFKSGGGLFIEDCNSQLINNTITTNLSGDCDSCDSEEDVYVEFSTNPENFDAEMVFRNGQGVLINNIIWSDTDDIIDFNEEAVNVTASYNIIKGGFPGTFNVDLDPLFINRITSLGPGDVAIPYLGDLRLQSNSPAIEFGDSSQYQNLTGTDPFADTDLAGANRIFDTRIDLGAYESESGNFLLAPNGITCLCPDAQIGESGTLIINGNSITFTKRDLPQLQVLISNDPQNPEIARTCTTGITNMAGLFSGVDTFNQDLSAWDVSNVITMSSMFASASSFNQDISSWDVSGVQALSGMFAFTDSFNQPLNNWDVSNVDSMDSMFREAVAFNQDISSWDVSNVIEMDSMFRDAVAFDQNISTWDVSGVLDMTSMFSGAISFNQDISNWCVVNIVEEPIAFGLPVSVQPIWGQQCDIEPNFELADNGITCLCPNAEIGDTGTLIINGEFKTFTKRSRGNVNGVLGLNALIAANQADPRIALTCTTGITNMSGLFENRFSFNQDISSWDVSSVTTMSDMFLLAFAFNQDISAWDISNVIDTSGMFDLATAFNQPLNNWDVSNINNMASMFSNASAFNQSLNNWDVSNVSNMSNMFSFADNFNQDLGNWDISSVFNMNNMFENVTLSLENYDALLNGWASLDSGETQIQQNVNFNGGNSQYCAGLEARDVLANTFGWTITDGGILERQLTWNGSVSSDWEDVNNWTPNELPNRCTDIIISPNPLNPLAINGNVQVKEVTLNSGASLTIPTGSTLEIDGELDLFSESDTFASIVVEGTVDVAGEIRYHRYTNAQANRNDLIAPPLSGQSWNSFITNDDNHNANILFDDGVAIPNTRYLFGPFEKGLTDDYVVYDYNDDESLVSGKGYRAATNTQAIDGNGEPLIFTGNIVSGNVDVTIENDLTGNFPEWNLIGNPYPTYLDVNAFLNHEVSPGVTNLSLLDNPTAAIYGYNANDSGNLWTITNLAAGPSLIAPGQGFFVSSSNAASTIQFTPEMQVAGTSDDFIQGRAMQLANVVSLEIHSNTDSAQTSVYFNDNASSGLDVGYDAAVFGGNVSEFGLYSHLVQDNQGVPMAIQTLHTNAINDVIIPLGIYAHQGEQLTFSIGDNTLLESTEVYLEDNLTNTFTLISSGDYTLTPNEELTGTGRFFLRFSSDVLSVEDADIDALNIYTNLSERTIIIEGVLHDNTEVFVYDLLGRKVIQQAMDNSVNKTVLDANSLSSGAYIVKLQNRNQSISRKVIID